MEITTLDFTASQQCFGEFALTEYERRMFNAFNGLGGTLKTDGNQWCAIVGEMPEHYIAGFGDTPAKAMNNWYNEYFNSKPK